MTPDEIADAAWANPDSAPEKLAELNRLAAAATGDDLRDIQDAATMVARLIGAGTVPPPARP